MKTLRCRLLDWYGRSARRLPWRETRDPYRIWVSEIMLQQTRVAAVEPYYERFLNRFPDVAALATAPEDEVLAVWSGLGYYSRARNMHEAARRVAAAGRFPDHYESIRLLPGVGDYTAAAISSIAFGLPHAAVDGNVLRVLSRLTNDGSDIRSSAGKDRLCEAAQALLDRKRPGDFNQAMMELGATVCLPREPKCTLCPLAGHCEARRIGRQRDLPVKSRGRTPVRLVRTLLLIERDGRVLLWKRPGGGRLRGFWELPEAEQLPAAKRFDVVGEFRHSITHHNYRIAVARARVRKIPEGFFWVPRARFHEIPLSTTARKALLLSQVVNDC